MDSQLLLNDSGYRKEKGQQHRGRQEAARGKRLSTDSQGQLFPGLSLEPLKVENLCFWIMVHSTPKAGLGSRLTCSNPTIKTQFSP